MRFRFMKRFLILSALFILCGFLLISRWSQDGLTSKWIGLIGEEGEKSFGKLKRRVYGDGDRIHSSTSNVDSEDFDDDGMEFPSSTTWIKNVLEKNLTREEAVDQLLKEIDNHIPQNDAAHTEEADAAAEVRTFTIWEPRSVTTVVSRGTSSSPKQHIINKPTRRKRKKRRRPNLTFAGFVNVHIWQAWCGSTIEDLRRNKHFPLYPDMRTTSQTLYVRHREQSYGQRVFGFIHPPKSGNYIFFLSSDDNSELWLSNSSSPNHIRKIAWVGNATEPENTPVGGFSLLESQKSKKIHLSRGGKYFIEILHKQNAFSDHVLVAWKGPKMKEAKTIVSKYISAYFDEDGISLDVNVVSEYIPETKASYPTHHHGPLIADSLLMKNISKFGSQDHRDHFHLTPFIDDSEIKDLLPSCPYNPSYVVDFEVNRYEGVYLIHETAVYPDDKTELTHMIPISDCDVRSMDSHRNSFRPTQQTDDSYQTDDQPDPAVQKKGNSTTKDQDTSKSGTFVIDSSFKSLLSKLKRQFKDFHSYVKSGKGLFGSIRLQSSQKAGKSFELETTKQKVNGKMNSKTNGLNSEVSKSIIKIDKIKQHRKNNLSSSKFNNDREEENENSEYRKKAFSEGKTKTHAPDIVKKRDVDDDGSKKYDIDDDNDRSLENRERIFIGEEGFAKVTLSKNGHPIQVKGESKAYDSDSEMKIEKNDSQSKSEYEVDGKQGLPEEQEGLVENNNRVDSKGDHVNPPNGVDSDDADKKTQNNFDANESYKNGRNGRKLLSFADDDKQVVMAEDTDDEGLPSTWNKFKRAKPVFVPIKGVENIDKPIPTEKIRARKMSVRSIFFNRKKQTEDSVPFEIKSYYKRFNITSNRDVIDKFKIFKYAFYDMIKDIPRLHGWKFHQDVTKCKSDGNLRLNEKVAESIVDRYMRALKKRHGEKYALKKIVNVEENHDVINGDRYLVELDLKLKGKGDKSVRLSRYVYQKVGGLNLCEPKGFQWNRHATLHVIVPVKNQGRWVQHFIDNMEQIYLETMDQHLNVIIVDFNSTDIDIEKSLKNSKLKRYKLIKLSGPFQRALGIQAGADSVTNPHDIIFTCDLHLEIPSSLIDNIRKHCVEGKMAFAPIVVRLDCGYLPENPYGLWELQGYGLFAICKSDFDKAGGMNTKEFKTKWGGEDWEMLDRILSSKMEVERLRIPKFYHYYHSKKGMWLKT